MDQNSVVNNIWIILIIWSPYYFADYYFTRYNSIHYPPILAKYFVHKGSFEIDQRLQNDIDNHRLFSFTFFKSWIISCLGFFLFWWLSKNSNLPQLFYGYSGLLFLLFGVTHLHHLRNFVAYKYLKKGEIIGRIEYSQSYDLKQSAGELLGFGIFYLLISVLIGSWFFFGGFISCVFVAFDHIMKVKKSKDLTDEKGQ